MNVNPTFGDQQKLTDLLSSQKFITGVYNTYCCEAATPSIRSTLASVLQEEHRIQEALFDEMNSRGWYPVTRAEDTKLAGAKQKFASKVTQ